MKRAPGFTLIELLVVIAIITILAGIMVPNIGPMIAKARMARAETEINNIELALTSMLADAGKRSFNHMWTVELGAHPADFFTNVDNVEDVMEIYQNAFYLLLRLGSGAESDDDWPAELKLRDDVRQSLGKKYMDLGTDPWGQKYEFYPGPVRYAYVPFRIYLPDLTVPGAPDEDDDDYEVTDHEDIETGETLTVGYAASKTMTIYIYSKGQNLESNQCFPSNVVPEPGATYDSEDAEMNQVGGGDDINNWDQDQSYKVHYN